MTALLILGVVFTLLLLFGVPVSFCIGIATVLALFTVTPSIDTALIVSAQRVASSLDSFTLVAIPLFILAGGLMNTGGIALRLIDLAKVLVGWLPGSLAQISVVANALFGAISGSAVASAASVGATLSPLQRKAGYDMPICAAANVAASPCGLLIPPSGALIVYSLISGGTPVDVLFVAGYIPGILMALSVMIWLHIVASRGDLPRDTQRYTLREALVVFWRALPALAMVLIIMGGIVAGVFTATEAAGAAALYTLVLSLLYRNLTWKKLADAMLGAAVGTAVVMLMVGVSMTMSWLLASTGSVTMLADAITGFSSNPIVLLLLFNVLLLLLGTFLDITPGLLILTPIFLPVAMKLGISPVHFGIIITFNLCIGIATPPVGSTLFVAARVANVSLAQLTRPLLPMFAFMIVALFLVTYIPALSLWLPQVLLGKTG
ncbi:TRAP dicarboxylate transporter, DctM subunit [Leptothrix cholodnii SP-6]|uniref:TRAP transporter large permease protein n=1 Tax=Leptothrix cholodnii (strain ATCC 51168 / LMG 8142 / SP-6) TaxID=395495 RepID=B1Y1L4_LEPCP|nr:TRAP transporter large permease [Leptothrix cholodnii]ACB35476.1 TRAP dicarboxylate transporter, DctM subunit [Leptothrix cholodnii SP-6]